MKRNRVFYIALAVGLPMTIALLLIAVVSPVRAAPPPGVVISQCANGESGGEPYCDGSGDTGWRSGKVGTNNSYYQLGDFIAYRFIHEDLVVNNRYCFGMWWDIAKAELPAIDYISTYSDYLDLANPLFGTGIPTTTPPVRTDIPADPVLQPPFYLNVPGEGFTGTLLHGPVGTDGSQGDLTLWGGSNLVAKDYSLTAASAITVNLYDASQSLEYCFTAVGTEAVLAWGGHIAVPAEWQKLDRPTGSPYHMKTGTTPNDFTDPRSTDSDLAEYPSSVPDFPPAADADHHNIGSQDIQLSVSEPTAITLESVSAGDSSDGLTLALIGVGLVALASAVVILFRRQRIQTS
ncbi:MAG: hypothetical protein WA996_02945 [Candidatus Promineifilaceae bacterium]